MELKPCPFDANAAKEVNNELTCSLDYRGEYERLNDICKKQHEEAEYYKEKFRCLEQENREMRAKLDIVYLIFGGHNHG